MRMLLNWVLSAFAVWLVSRIVPGIHVSGVTAALIAALVIGFVNATLGLVLKIVTFPLTVLTLGIFWLVINALMLKFASIFVPGFQVNGFLAAFIGAIVLSLAGLFVPIPFMALDVLTGAIQAYIFTVLAMVYIGAALAEGRQESPVNPERK